MYIEKYWGDYIGGSDDSLTLLEYLAGKEKEEISLKEILADSGLDKAQDDLQHVEGLCLCVDGFEAEICYGISLITDLAALLLECRVNGTVNMGELLENEFDPDSNLCITATEKEHELMNQALTDFAATPTSYNLSEMMDEDELQEMAEVCEQLRRELYE